MSITAKRTGIGKQAFDSLVVVVVVSEREGGRVWVAERESGDRISWSSSGMGREKREVHRRKSGTNGLPGFAVVCPV